MSPAAVHQVLGDVAFLVLHPRHEQKKPYTTVNSYSHFSLPCIIFSCNTPHQPTWSIYFFHLFCLLRIFPCSTTAYTSSVWGFLLGLFAPTSPALNAVHSTSHSVMWTENPKKTNHFAPRIGPFWPIHQEVDLEAELGFSLCRVWGELSQVSIWSFWRLCLHCSHRTLYPL